MDEIRDLLEEMLRRLGHLEMRGKLSNGEIIMRNSTIAMNSPMDNDSIQENNHTIIEENTQLKKEVKKLRDILNKEKKERQIAQLKKKALQKNNRIDEMEWLNLLNEMNSGINAFQLANWSSREVREQVGSVLLNRVKKWLKNKNVV
jgi:hypothetical protein